MNLVDILARELKEWPERAVSFVQDFDGTTKWTEMPDDPYLTESSNTWIRQDGNGKRIEVRLNASDWKTAIVTREMWQAAKYKLEGKVKAPKANKDGWKRHRGGKCPVEAGTLIDVRYRDGQVNIGVGACDGSKGSASRSAVYWRHDGDSANIMAYRLHKPGLVTDKESSEVEQSVKVSDHVKISVTPIPVPDDFNPTAEETESARRFFEGPLQWRDRIHAIDAEQKAADEAHKDATDARTAERAELVQKLAGEGLALIVKVDADDMSDPRNWKRGDVVECVSDYSNQFTRGKFYTLRSDYREEEYSVKIFKDDTGDTFNGWNPENFK